MAEKKQAPLNKLLTIYFYHTRLTRESYEEWKEYKFPGHILYGLPLLERGCVKTLAQPLLYFTVLLYFLLAMLLFPHAFGNKLLYSNYIGL